jgi:16S rRNA (uracil1498-N3)-methyltransferase
VNPRIFVDIPLSEGQTVDVTGENGHHFARVLRVVPGEQVALASAGQAYLGHVIDVDTRHGVVRVLLQERLESHESATKVYLVQALAKGDKIDTILQHNTELGVAGFLVVATAHSVVRLDEHKSRAKLNRWRKVVREAASQSQRDLIPTVDFTARLPEALAWCRDLAPDLVAFLDEKEDETGLYPVLESRTWDSKQQTIVIVVGPEGGWSDVERTVWSQQAAAVRTSLGRRTLRTETAGLVAASAMLHHFRQLGG